MLIYTASVEVDSMLKVPRSVSMRRTGGQNEGV